MNVLTIFVAAAIVGWISATIACAVRDARRAVEDQHVHQPVCAACVKANDHSRERWDFALWETECRANR